jgi:hypothetical protein
VVLQLFFLLVSTLNINPPGRFASRRKALVVILCLPSGGVCLYRPQKKKCWTIKRETNIMRVSKFIDENFRLHLPMMPFTLTDSCVRSTIEFFRLSNKKTKNTKFVTKHRAVSKNLNCDALYFNNSFRV